MYGETIGYIIYDDGRKEEAVHLNHGNGRIDYEIAEKQATQSTIQLFEYRQRNYSFGPKPVRWTITTR